MMHISPMRETARQRAARVFDAAIGAGILLLTAVFGGATGAAIVLWLRGGA
jgi:hypothetical protein